ncbi:cilia- and flagella-associated protein 298-like isoform X3 [Neocloeon triangulifer]|uniref:cilia- and flagella-associated protein 298-like isoform X3 n=1 Tax=Neocloeon triangulifer TaxID=2078957 RepID=UPI00286EC022|nr:cilia- and flagella-associated protein 298-like isoform X3 [Neocloeon triangulifer]
MVLLHIKHGAESLFLYEATCDTDMKTVYEEVTSIYNGRLKITQLCYDIEDLAKYGPVMPLDMQGLAPGQAEELKLVDDWADKCEVNGGWSSNPDPMGRRNGRQPNEDMQKVLLKSVEEAKQSISKDQVGANIALTTATISEALHQLRGATMVVYPMELPPHDPCFLTQEECNSVIGILVDDREFIDGTEAMLWFCSRHLSREGPLHKAINSKNEKTKIVVKLSGAISGPPAKEDAISEEERLKMLAYYRRKQDELQRLDQASSHDGGSSYDPSAEWTDSSSLKRQLAGFKGPISWRP